MSSNLLKMGFANVQDSKRRVIDTNELVSRRIEELAKKMAQEEMSEEAEGGISPDGFSAGLSAEQVEGLLWDEESEGGSQSNVIKEPTKEEKEAQKVAERNAQREELLVETKGAADVLLADALQKARVESERIMMETRVQIEAERQSILNQAREEGYEEGYRQAMEELESHKEQLDAQVRAMEQQYEEIVDCLEPQMVDVITQAYEFLIGVELSGYRDILIHMISSTIRRIEGCKEFVVHVSGEDRPYVSMEKKQLESALSSPGAGIEIVEDVTLGRNECRIETESGIFDCSLDLQLAELKKRLRLLSFEKA